MAFNAIPKFSKAFLSVCGLLVLISAQAKGNVTFETKEWAVCQSEISQQAFPRSCLVLAVLTQKVNFQKMHQELELYCLQHIKQWAPLDQADILILERYYPKCLHRLYAISNSKERVLKVENLKSDLVRFLYLRQDADSDQDSKRVPNIITTGPGSK